MAWNDNKNPWGDKQNSTPPELDESSKISRINLVGFSGVISHLEVLKRLFRFLHPKVALNI